MRAQDTNTTDCLLVLWVKLRPIPLLHIPVGTEAEFSLSTWSNPPSKYCRAGKGQDLAWQDLPEGLGLIPAAGTGLVTIGATWLMLNARLWSGAVPADRGSDSGAGEH